MSMQERILERVQFDTNGGCWLWEGANAGGYGRINFGRGKKTISTHRLMWESQFGAIPSGMVICHKCDVPSCVNPNHLWLGTQTANMADMSKKGRAPGGTALGKENGNSKLTESEVLEIRAAKGFQREIGERFGISQVAVSDIKRLRRWKHLGAGALPPKDVD